MSDVRQLARETIAAADAAALREALIAAHGAVRTAARALGINPTTAHERITRLGLRPWLDATFPRSVRQPGARAAKIEVPSKKRGRPRKDIGQ